jgi:hypothetical protein
MEKLKFTVWPYNIMYLNNFTVVWGQSSNAVNLVKKIRVTTEDTMKLRTENAEKTLLSILLCELCVKLRVLCGKDFLS